MRNLKFTVLSSLAAALIFVCASQAGAEQSGEWISLFNGKDLCGWAQVNCAKETFTVRDGMIICTGIPTGVLRTDRMYENYVLELEWRHMKQGGNAGLFVHSDALPARGQPFTRSIEVQVMDGNAGDIFSIHGASMTPYKLHPRGPGNKRSLPAKDTMNPAGEWNHYKVISRNGTLTLYVNGEVVNWAYDCDPRKGYICLESEGSEIHFRNLKIMELPSSHPPMAEIATRAEGFKALYTGLDLRNWKQNPGHEGHWVADNWRIKYDGKSEAEPHEEKNLWSEKSYRNFELIVDWRQPGEAVVDTVPVILPDGSYIIDEQTGQPKKVPVMDAGDSGIYLRGSSKAQINIWNWPIGSGEFYGYRLDQSMAPAVRAGVTPILNADRPIGQWNRFHITMIDDRVTVALNGRTVIDDALLPGVPPTGPIALQHHGDLLEFANVFIKELP
ncbi:MAG: DUF1080 domain-containing protein [Candidatus Glassbacteria bacterium]|nr:DUF1080 domain-containing protein [Candidatus Glassbacteria bacterium]